MKNLIILFLICLNFLYADQNTTASSLTLNPAKLETLQHYFAEVNENVEAKEGEVDVAKVSTKFDCKTGAISLEGSVLDLVDESSQGGRSTLDKIIVNFAPFAYDFAKEKPKDGTALVQELFLNLLMQAVIEKTLDAITAIIYKIKKGTFEDVNIFSTDSYKKCLEAGTIAATDVTTKVGTAGNDVRNQSFMAGLDLGLPFKYISCTNEFLADFLPSNKDLWKKTRKQVRWTFYLVLNNMLDFDFQVSSKKCKKVDKELGEATADNPEYTSGKNSYVEKANKLTLAILQELFVPDSAPLALDFKQVLGEKKKNAATDKKAANNKLNNETDFFLDYQMTIELGVNKKKFNVLDFSYPKRDDFYYRALNDFSKAEKSIDSNIANIGYGHKEEFFEAIRSLLSAQMLDVNNINLYRCWEGLDCENLKPTKCDYIREYYFNGFRSLRKSDGTLISTCDDGLIYCNLGPVSGDSPPVNTSQFSCSVDTSVLEMATGKTSDLSNHITDLRSYIKNTVQQNDSGMYPLKMDEEIDPTRLRNMAQAIINRHIFTDIMSYIKGKLNIYTYYDLENLDGGPTLTEEEITLIKQKNATDRQLEYFKLPALDENTTNDILAYAESNALKFGNRVNDINETVYVFKTKILTDLFLENFLQLNTEMLSTYSDNYNFLRFAYKPASEAYISGLLTKKSLNPITLFDTNENYVQFINNLDQNLSAMIPFPQNLLDGNYKVLPDDATDYSYPLFILSTTHALASKGNTLATNARLDDASLSYLLSKFTRYFLNTLIMHKTNQFEEYAKKVNIQATDDQLVRHGSYIANKYKQYIIYLAKKELYRFQDFILELKLLLKE